MLRIFYSDFRFLFKQLSFKIVTGVVVGYSIFFVVALKLVIHFVNEGNMISGEDVLSSYNDIATLAITAATLLLLNSDFANGTIRNKLARGIKRSEIYLSSIFNGMLAAVVLTAITVFFEIILALIFTDGFITFTVKEMADNILKLLITASSIGAFTSMFIMVFGGTKIAYFVGFVLAFFFDIIGAMVTNDLYPMSGNCTLEGTKLVLYTAYDRFMPYMHFEEYPRWDIFSYLIGSGVLIAVSIFVGMIIFEKKEIK